MRHGPFVARAGRISEGRTSEGGKKERGRKEEEEKIAAMERVSLSTLLSRAWDGGVRKLKHRGFLLKYRI